MKPQITFKPWANNTKHRARFDIMVNSDRWGYAFRDEHGTGYLLWRQGADYRITPKPQTLQDIENHIRQTL